ncbi:MAG: substrate-binding domain-containing protein [Clostridiales bacterium]|nr:substrate-binding domain-containing protein [Clostridiales bacterium]
MKKSISLVLVLLVILAMPAAILAETPINLSAQGAAAVLSAQAQPYLSDQGDSMVPLSFLDQLGIRTGWNAQTGTAVLINGKIAVATAAGTTVDGSSSTYDLSLVVRGGIPYVKIRSVANIFGLSLEWNGSTKTVQVPQILPVPMASNKELILATTTSTQDSGLLDFLLPEFEKDTGILAKPISVGSGAAIKMGTDGEADVLLVHSRVQELEAMSAGDAISRNELMYNDFIIVGPESDPAGVKSAGNKALDAFKAIHDKGAVFVSRGDKSGTDTLEKSLWTEAGITPDASTYLEAATGMLATLTIAEQREGYTVTDRATYLKNLDKLSLVILCEGDSLLLNQYSVMVVNPDKNDKINYLAAMQFSDWMLSEKGQALINDYGVSEYGKPLFFANYKPAY